MTTGLTYPYTCRHCGQTVTEPGHAAVCPVTTGQRVCHLQRSE